MRLRTRSARCRTFVGKCAKAFLACLTVCSVAWPVKSAAQAALAATTSEHTRAQLADLRGRLRVGEHAEVASGAEQIIVNLEANMGRYHAALVAPLTLLGDARLDMGDAESALQAYDRAKHITRIDDGVQGLAQMNLLYREADAFVALRDLQSANDRHEFAYSLKLRKHGADSPLLLPGLEKLAEWYRHHYKFRPAQLLYEQIIEISKRQYPPTDERIIDLMRTYASTYRERRFGSREPGRGRFSAWPPGHPKDPPWRPSATFRKGRNALREVLALTKQTASAMPVDVAMATVALADWHLLHYEYGAAMRNYRRAWALLESNDELRAETFEKPTPLFLRLPNDPAAMDRQRGQPYEGIVQLSLNVTHRGDVVGRRTLLAEPRNLMEFKLRKAAKQARYRPAFVAGDPVPRQDLKIEFKYRYYPGDEGLN